MIRNARPRVAVVHARLLDVKSPHINTIELEHRQCGRKAARWMAVSLLEYLLQPEWARQLEIGMVRPVVEIAGDNQRRLAGHQPFDTHLQRPHLAAAMMFHQPQMDAHAMQRFAPSRYLDLAMQQPAALEAMFGNIFVVPARNGETAQYRVAVVTGIVNRIPAVGE